MQNKLPGENLDNSGVIFVTLKVLLWLSVVAQALHIIYFQVAKCSEDQHF
jgi:hypothetical protein